MKLLVLYRPNSEHSLAIEKYCEDLKKEIYGINLQLIDVDSAEGSERMNTYGIMSFPAFVATRDDGQVQNIWQSEHMPSKDELEAYLLN